MKTRSSRRGAQGDKKDEPLGRFHFNDSDPLPCIDERLPPEHGDEEGTGDELEDAIGFDTDAHPRGQPIPSRGDPSATARGTPSLRVA